MCEEGRKTTRTPTKPERIAHRLLRSILTLLELRCAHRLPEGRHVDRKQRRSCMKLAREVETLLTSDCDLNFTCWRLLRDREILRIEPSPSSPNGRHRL
jgi:hypothetical protein